MGNGRIEQIGINTEIYDKPTSSYVAKFLGINSFKGKALKTVSGVTEIEANGFQMKAVTAQAIAGKKIIVTIKPEDIIVSKSTDPDFKGAPNNAIEGIVTEMVQMRSNAQVTIDAGFQLKTRISLSEVKNQAIRIGDKVHVFFSFDALNVFADTEGN